MSGTAGLRDETHILDAEVARLRAALRDSEARLRQAQEVGGVGVFSVGVPDGLVSATPEFCRLYGLPARDRIPSPAFERLIVEEDAARVSTAQARLKGEAPLDVEYRIRRADTGEERWIARTGAFERDAEGRPIRFVGVARDITDQMRARRELEDEREQLAQLFEQAPTFMAILRGPEHRFERVNPGYTRLVGGRSVVGRTVAEALPDAVEQGYLSLLDGVYRSGRPFAAYGSRFAVQAEPGGPVEERHVDFVYQPIRDKAGHVSGIFVEGADVTDRMLAGEALRATEERYRTLLESVDVGFCIVEMKFDDAGRAVDYRLVEGNPAFERQTGLVGVFGRWVSEVAPGLERHWFDAYGHVALTGEPVRFENGAEIFGRWYDVRALRVGDPEAHRVAILFSDISERKRMEERLRVLNASLGTEVAERTRERDRLWQTTNDLMGTAGLDGFLKAVNPAWTRMLGWSEQELLTRPFMDIVNTADHAETADVVRRLAAGETVTDFVDHVRARNGDHRTINWTAVSEPGSGVFYIVGRDITEQRRIEEQLRQAQKMEAVGQLTGGLAHDFNNLLAGISGSLELMGTRIQQGRLGDVERYLVAAQGAAKRAAALTHRLLAFSRRQTLEPKPTDVNRLVAGMEELVRRTVGPQVALEVVAVDGLWSTLVDPNQLENALLNLCINARDAMPDGGKLVIETANGWLDERTARERDLAPGPYVSLCVSDNGTGMTPDVVERAFDPFFTTKPIGVGTGLGLSMIYGFARQSGGQVRIDSEVGKGTTVCLHLPQHHGEEVPEPRPASASIGPAQAGETVLVIDDEPLVRMLVVDVLEEQGYTAIEAEDGPSGLTILRSNARIDLLITDVGLPNGMNGRQVADAARELRPGLKVLFVTGYAENAVLSHGHLDPGMHVITKPFAVEALAGRVKDLIAG